jgi:hypothetical protein
MQMGSPSSLPGETVCQRPHAESNVDVHGLCRQKQAQTDQRRMQRARVKGLGWWAHLMAQLTKEETLL